MHLWKVICHILFWGHCDLDIWPRLQNYRVWSIYPVLFEVGIPNLVCGFILGLWSGAYHFRSLCPLKLTLDYDYDYHIWGISPILQLTFLKCVLC